MPILERRGASSRPNGPGVSLTVASVPSEAPDRFEVVLIPETLRATTLGDARPRDAVNVETDYLLRAVITHARRSGARGNE